MVYRYKRKTQRQSWTAMSMAKAAKSVIDGEMGTRKASQSYGVPRSTLQRKIKAYRINPDIELTIQRDLGRYQPVFSPAQELELVGYLKAQEATLHGLTRRELRILVCQLADKNGIPHPFPNGQAGKGWFKGFMERHKTLSLRKPEPTSAARAAGFNNIVINNFYDLLEEILAKHRITAERIYNVDETGYSSVPKSQPRIIATRGKKQVGVWTAAERGQLVTAEICVSAAGSWLPPVFVFPRVRMNAELVKDALPGSWGVCEPSGWMTTVIFLRWFKWFVEQVEPTKESPVLLIFDGHSTHTKNVDVIDYARSHSVILLCLPPHTTHKMQPIDVSLMRPMSQAYAEEIRHWGRENPGCSMTPAIVCKLVCQAFSKSAKPKTIISGFKRSGICPFNRGIFKDEEFVPAEVTNQPDPAEINGNASLDNNMTILEHLSSSLSVLPIQDGRARSPHNSNVLSINEQRAPSFDVGPEHQFEDRGPIGTDTAGFVKGKDVAVNEESTLHTASTSNQRLNYDEPPFLSDFVRNLVAQKARAAIQNSTPQVDPRASANPSPTSVTGLLNALNESNNQPTGPRTLLKAKPSRVVDPHRSHAKSPTAHCSRISLPATKRRRASGQRLELSSNGHSPVRKESRKNSPPCESRFNWSAVAHCSRTSPSRTLAEIQQPGTTVQRLEFDSSSDEDSADHKMQIARSQFSVHRTTRDANTFTVTPYDLKPLPKARDRQTQRRRARAKTAVLTDSPYRSELMQSKLGKKKVTSRRSRGHAARKATTPRDVIPSVDPGEGEDAACIFCEEQYSISTEEWIQCSSCRNWAHNLCAGTDDSTKDYTCDYCDNSI